MKRRTQKHTTGCGIACVAMLANKNYDEIYRTAVEIGVVSKEGDKYTTTGDLKKIASAHNITISCSRKKMFKGWVHLPNKAVLAVKRGASTQYWHWVVFYREPKGKGAYVLDPTKSVKTNKRTDFSRIKVFAFLPIAEHET